MVFVALVNSNSCTFSSFPITIVFPQLTAHNQIFESHSPTKHPINPNQESTSIQCLIENINVFCNVSTMCRPIFLDAHKFESSGFPVPASSLSGRHGRSPPHAAACYPRTSPSISPSPVGPAGQRLAMVRRRRGGVPFPLSSPALP